ncbi:MAG: hypothetical protein AB7F87_12405 [Oligoflexales bacterium]
MTTPKRVYWLTIDKQSEHEKKAALLDARGYKVEFFKTLDSLTKALRNQRVTILVVGDEGPETFISKAVTLLRHMPDIQGARLLLSVSRSLDAILRLAACEGFRDMVPLELKNEDWLRRFEFSTSGQPASFAQKAQDRQLNKPASILVPARAVWLTTNRIWIESRVAAETGDKLALVGPLAQSMGRKSIAIEIQRRYQDNLFYRFSEALVGSWETKDNTSTLTSDTLELLKNLNTGRRCKAFLAIQSPALRSALLSYLPAEKFEVHSALQKRSVVEEPKYFSPDLVFIEDRFCKGEYLDRFRTMEQNLPKHCAIVVVGSQRSQPESLHVKRRVHFLNRIPKNLEEVLLKQVLDFSKLPSLADTGAFFIPSDHEFSLAELDVQAEIRTWSDSGLTLIARSHIGNFALAQVKCKELEAQFGTAPYIKVINVQPDPNERGAYVVEAQFCAVPNRNVTIPIAETNTSVPKIELEPQKGSAPIMAEDQPKSVEEPKQIVEIHAQYGTKTPSNESIRKPDADEGLYVMSLIALSAVVSLVVSILFMFQH